MNEPFIPAVKAGLAAVGFPVGGPRPPFAALDPAATARIARLAKTTTMEAARCHTASHDGEGCGAPVRPRRPPAGRRSASRPALHRRGVPAGPVRLLHRRVDPSSERTIAQVAEGTAEDTDAAVAAAVAAAPAWAALTPKERSELLHRVADRVAENADLLARLESANTGKPSAVAQDDVAQTVDTFRFMAGALRAPTSAAAGRYAEDHLSVILREPLGVIGVVTPWNYPLLMAAWKMAPILAAGNTLVIKPSEQTPLTTLKFAELVADILPAGVLNVVTGYGPVVGARLAEHPDIAMIALTGSVRSGKAVARAAAESLKRVHLELGGKAPVVIFPDADLAAAATALRAAGYWNSGQECGAACRVLVHESVADEFAELLVKEVATMVVGEPGAGDDVEIGPLTSKAHFDRVTGYLQRAEAEGIRAAIGGGALEGVGYFVAPTVLVDVPDGAECAREEIFGPVVTVETFTEEDEAVTRANSVPYGLSASVWTKDARRSHDVAVEARRRHGLGQRPPGARQRGPVGRVQGLRLRPRPVDLRARRLLPHQARHAQRGALRESGAAGEHRRTHLLGEPPEVLFGGHPRGGRIAAHDGLDDRPLAADVLVGRQLLLQAEVPDPQGQVGVLVEGGLEELVAGGRVDRPVHAGVELGVVGALVAAVLQVVEQLQQRRAILLRRPLGGERRRQALELHADLGEPGLVGDVDPGDEGAPPGVGDRELLQRQPLERVADRGQPQPQRRAQRLLVERCARLQAHRHDGVADLAVRLVHQPLPPGSRRNRIGGAAHRASWRCGG